VPTIETTGRSRNNDNDNDNGHESSSGTVIGGIKYQYQAFKYITTFKTFPLQELAFTCFDELQEQQQIRTRKHQHQHQHQHNTLWSKEPRLFALEYNNEGKRKYLVSHLGRFMHYYWRECDPKDRHYYELIRENSPCRLYFGK